jgi:hypothetical protein
LGIVKEAVKEMGEKGKKPVSSHLEVVLRNVVEERMG